VAGDYIRGRIHVVYPSPRLDADADTRRVCRRCEHVSRSGASDRHDAISFAKPAEKKLE
jgi:hypothetical protein